MTANDRPCRRFYSQYAPRILLRVDQSVGVRVRESLRPPWPDRRCRCGCTASSCGCRYDGPAHGLRQGMDILPAVLGVLCFDGQRGRIAFKIEARGRQAGDFGPSESSQVGNLRSAPRHSSLDALSRRIRRSGNHRRRIRR